jgi:hypothetical protein
MPIGSLFVVVAFGVGVGAFGEVAGVGLDDYSLCVYLVVDGQVDQVLSGLKAGWGAVWALA